MKKHRLFETIRPIKGKNKLNTKIILEHKYFMPAILSFAFCLTVFFVWFGFGTRQSKVDYCWAQTSAWITAEYSSEECGYEVNLEGEYEYGCQTDYESEPASEVWKVITVNGEVSDSYGRYIVNSEQYFNAQYPPITEPGRGRDFDNHKKHFDRTVRMYFIDNDYQSNKKYSKCLLMIGNNVTVKTWYRSAYGTVE